MDISAFRRGECVSDGLRTKNAHWIPAISILGANATLPSIAMGNKLVIHNNNTYVDFNRRLGRSYSDGFYAKMPRIKAV
jgi:hypothetical protein